MVVLSCRMNLQLVCDGTAGLCAGFQIEAQDNTGNNYSVTGSATIDTYASAFLAAAGNDKFQIVPKIVLAPGAATQTVTATFTSGSLPPVSVSVDLVAPPPPATPTQLVITIPPSEGTGSALTDPGSATISFSLT